MIISRLRGGLGNQLFQYACGRALAIRNNDILKLDITNYSVRIRKEMQREYTLSHYQIKADVASDSEVRRYKYPLGIASKAIRLFKVKVLRIFNTGFDPKVLKWKGNIYLDGFWQSERYFTDVESDIRADFRLKDTLGNQASSVLAKIKASPRPVSLHIRRGDLVINQHSDPHAGVCTPAYYERAVERIKALFLDAELFIFSDDIDWVRKNMKFSLPMRFVSEPGITDYEEIHLMSQCKHNIIANSSFSWWGAWLNGNPGKVVLTPDRWVTRGKEEYHDIVPNDWIPIQTHA